MNGRVSSCPPPPQQPKPNSTAISCVADRSAVSPYPAAGQRSIVTASRMSPLIPERPRLSRRWMDLPGHQRVYARLRRRMIDKWLKAGVLEDGLLRHSTAGSPQGGVISPCFSNILLHHVLDEWFEHDVRPRLKGRCTLVRFADDAVMAFEHVLDAAGVARCSSV